jgi:hypothetical protein
MHALPQAPIREVGSGGSAAAAAGRRSESMVIVIGLSFCRYF